MDVIRDVCGYMVISIPSPTSISEVNVNPRSTTIENDYYCV